jgi:hypothetical protein
VQRREQIGRRLKLYDIPVLISVMRPDKRIRRIEGAGPTTSRGARLATSETAARAILPTRVSGEQTEEASNTLLLPDPERPAPLLEARFRARSRPRRLLLLGLRLDRILVASTLPEPWLGLPWRLVLD